MSPNRFEQQGQRPDNINNKQNTPKNTQKKGSSFAWAPFVIIPILIIAIAAMIPFYMAAISSRAPSDTGAPADTAEVDTTSAPDATAPTRKPPEAPSVPAGIGEDFSERTSATVNVSSAINSGYAILINRETGKVIAQKNPSSRIYPASMTKLMTLIVAYENAYSLDDTFVMTEEIIAPLEEENASVAGFTAGEKITVRDMLYGAALPSGADATGGLAVHIAGSEENFVALMNKKARELGLVNTHFVNASGLHDDNHYSTVEEIAKIFEYALSIPVLREILTTRTYTSAKTPEHPDGIFMGSTMFSQFTAKYTFVGATLLGGKTGYTLEALRCLASLAVSKNGTECILVTAHAETMTACLTDAVYMHTKYTANQ